MTEKIHRGDAQVTMRGVAGDKETVERQNNIGGTVYHSHPNLRRPLLPDVIQLWYYRTRAPYNGKIVFSTSARFIQRLSYDKLKTIILMS